MKTYATKYKIFAEPIPSCEYEVLNELKDLTSRKDSNCLKHTRFLFEMDEIPLNEQFSGVPSIRRYCRRIVFSGSKSLHHIVEFDPKYEEQCRVLYKEIWTVLNGMLFAGNADSACSNPARLTRRPCAIRQDNGKIQELLYAGEFFPDDIAKLVIRKAKSLHIAERMKSQNASRCAHKSFHNGLCANYDVITRYLNTPFPHLKGNGVSSKWLFSAIACCIKYNDMTTLQRVKDKAFREHWSMKELDRIEENINNNTKER